ncbi:MAG: hypothetical protein V7K68_05315 [Nostoc sp.]|uniref:type II toxin-antitoxin system RelN family antitoxin n=1 Tax=Nostoc sp. TaxID=1180 RepID=UPI002FF68225
MYTVAHGGKGFETHETTATINESGQLTLDTSLGFIKPQRVRVIVLLSEDDETDPDETPTEIVIESIRQDLHQALTGQTLPLSEMWSGIDAE